MRRWGQVTGRAAAVRTEYRGHFYQSKSEARFARDLDLRVAAGEIVAWQPQVRIPFRAPSGVVVWTHVVDFQVEHRDGSLELVELKGFMEQDAKLKSKVLALVVVPELCRIRPTRYTLLKSNGEPWPPPKRRGKGPSVTA